LVVAWLVAESPAGVLREASPLAQVCCWRLMKVI
jgi:hypothetical protein